MVFSRTGKAKMPQPQKLLRSSLCGMLLRSSISSMPHMPKLKLKESTLPKLLNGAPPGVCLS